MTTIPTRELKPTPAESAIASASGVLELVTDVERRYEIAALKPLLRICESTAKGETLSIAVLGRFKAGKSSFLNALIGRDLLPVGVVPVTSVITEMQWASEERSGVHFLDGRNELIPMTALAEFISEARNPGNTKHVSKVCIFLPELAHYKNIRLIDTPGLESAFSHNTDVSLGWAPNADIAVVAIAVDPPLSKPDIDLIHKLFEYTPQVHVLLTKVDILNDRERQEVYAFVGEQLSRHFEQQIRIFPYSTRPGFERLKLSLEEQLLVSTASTIQEQKNAILAHKLNLLLSECGDYVRIALRSAQMLETEKQQLRERSLQEKQALLDTKLELQLIARHAMSAARNGIEKILLPQRKSIEKELADALEQEYPAWKMRFADLQRHFEAWLENALVAKLGGLSAAKRVDFLTPLEDVQRQYVRVLQAFRDRLSQRAMEVFGVPLRTTETEIRPSPPKSLDVKIGRMFDHNWELLSPILSMTLLRQPVRRRFLRKVQDETFKNLSRLTTQWTEIVSAATLEMQREAERRLDELLQTVERLTRSSTADVRAIELDLERLEQAQMELRV